MLHLTLKCLLTDSPTPWLGSRTRFLWKVSLKPKRHPRFLYLGCFHRQCDQLFTWCNSTRWGQVCTFWSYKSKAGGLEPQSRQTPERGQLLSQPLRSEQTVLMVMFYYFSYSTGLPVRMAMLALFLFSFGLAILQACRAIDSGSGKRTQIVYYSFK